MVIRWLATQLGPTPPAHRRSRLRLAEVREPTHVCTRVILVDGARHHLDLIRAELILRSVFTEPERLCPHKAYANRHLAFGIDNHLCPGASLTRAEATVALPAADQPCHSRISQ